SSAPLFPPRVYSRCIWRTARAAGRSAQFFSHSATLGNGRHVDIGRPRPGKDAGNIEIGDRKILSEQVWTAAERTVEHAKRLRELLLTDIGRCSIALALGIDRSVQQRREQRALDFRHAPEAPLPGPRLVFETARIKSSGAVFLRQIQID